MRQWPAGCKRLLGGESERKIDVMTKAAEAVLADALRLDLDARAEIAAELLASLDGPADPDAEAAWAVEIERRVAAIEAGTVKLEPWEDVKRRIEKEILGR
jgi:putative addiction module component (TIGR02574 family)